MRHLGPPMKKSCINRAVWPLVLGCLLTSCSSATKTPDGVGAYPKSVGAADEGSAIQSLRTIATAQTQAKVMRGSYADFDSLVQLGFLDQRFAGSNPNVRGYRFTMTAGENEFVVNADPQTTQTAPTTGNRHFYMDSSDNFVHVNSSQSATRRDPLL